MGHSSSILLYAAQESHLALPVVASALIGISVALVVRAAVVALRPEDVDPDDQWRYDVTRIAELRRISLLYRLFQPLILLLAHLNRRAFRDSLREMGREIQAAGLPRVWTAAEYLGRMQVIALLLTPAYFYLCIDMMGPPGIVLACVFSVLTVYWLRRRLAGQAQHRLLQIKRRLPYLLDLLTLLMEAGSTFLQALREAAGEFREHPVGIEFGRVLAEMSMGKSRTAALESLRERLSDDEITSITGSIIQGENLGTPLVLIFRTQADVLRIKRTQRAETVANEAGVKMLLPAILVMLATVIIILGPFIISFIYGDYMS